MITVNAVRGCLEVVDAIHTNMLPTSLDFSSSMANVPLTHLHIVYIGATLLRLDGCEFPSKLALRLRPAVLVRSEVGIEEVLATWTRGSGLDCVC